MMDARHTAALFALTIVPILGASARAPNILFCISDDQSFPHTSAYGTTWVNTPAFDRIAKEGLLFTRAYTPNAKCAPSRASVLTGRYSWQLESAANHGGYYPDGYRTFMEALGANGYFVGFTGKGWAPGEPGLVDGRRRELTGKAYNERRAARPTEGISPTDYAGNFADFLAARQKDQPFCFWYGGYEPHRRYEPGSGGRIGGKDPAAIDRVPAYWPDNAIVRQDLLDYAYEIEHFDDHLGRMLAMLEAAGELDNTLVIVTADNGMPFPRAKGTTYDVSLHVPLAIRWPQGITAPGRVVADFVNFVDLAPTIVGLAGLDAAAAGMEAWAGETLVPIFRQQPSAADRGWTIFGQERHDVGRPGDVGYPVRGCVTERHLYVRNLAPERWPMGDPVTGYLNTDGSPTKTLLLERNRAGINHWQWELNFGRRPAEELYDLQRDPDCLHNLAADPIVAETKAALTERLADALQRHGDPRSNGDGDLFDRYPTASQQRGFYERYLRGEVGRELSWVDPTDFETLDFDPEKPAVLPADVHVKGE